MEKQKIAFLTNSMEKGGAEMAVFNLLTQFQDKYELHLLLTSKKLQFKIPENVKISFLEEATYGNIKNILLLPSLGKKYAAYLKQHHIHYSISFLERPNYIAGIAKKKYPQCKYIITISSALGEWYKKRTIHGEMGRFLISRLYKRADVIVPCAKFLESHMQEEFGLKKQRCQTIYNGVDMDRVRALGQEDIPLKKEAFWFVHLGSFYTVKNHRLLIDAFEIATKDIDAQLLLLGKGYLLEQTKEYVKTKGLSNKVNVIGYTENPFAYIAKSDCFVLSSNSEGLPTVLIEAMALDVPVIATDCKSGPREILAPGTDYTVQIQNQIEDARYGTLVPVKNEQLMAAAMVALYNDEHKQAQYKNLSKEGCRIFSIENTATQYIQLMNSL